MTRSKKIAVAGLVACTLFGAGFAGNVLAGHHGTPAAGKDIVATAVEAGQFNTLVAAVKAAGLVEALQGEGPFTVFAPTDEAFAKLPAGTVESLLEPANRDKLVSILTYHVVPGRVLSSDVTPGGRAKTLQGGQVSFSSSGSGLRIDNANIVATDITTSNGVIHVIDAVILPDESRQSRLRSMELIELAISKGAPMYNNHQPAACTAMYELTAQSLLNLDSGLGESDRATLTAAMEAVGHTDDARRQAWIMREALDEVYASMSVR